MIIDYSSNSYTIEDDIIEEIDVAAKHQPSRSLIDIAKEQAEEDAKTIIKNGHVIAAVADRWFNRLKVYDANPGSSFYRAGAELWPIYCERLLEVVLELNPNRCLKFTQLPTW